MNQWRRFWRLRLAGGLFWLAAVMSVESHQRDVVWAIAVLGFVSMWILETVVAQREKSR